MINMYLFLILLSLGAVKASIRTVREPGPPYNCSYCQPEQIHIAFGGKFLIYLFTYNQVNILVSMPKDFRKTFADNGTFEPLAETTGEK